MDYATYEKYSDLVGKIVNNVGLTDQLLQTAEESAELAQAALKVERAIKGTTPVSVENALKNLQEEIADVLLCTDVLETYYGFDFIIGTSHITLQKAKRWVWRLEQLEAGEPMEE